MTLGEELRRKYALTSLKSQRDCLPLLAINEALEAAAEVAEREQALGVAISIRKLKWTERSVDSVGRVA